MSLILCLWFQRLPFCSFVSDIHEGCQNADGFTAQLSESLWFYCYEVSKILHVLFYIDSRVLQSGPGDLELAHR